MCKKIKVRNVCIVEGCNNLVWERSTKGPKPVVCDKHYWSMVSGRVSYKHVRRDVHLFHRKAYCEGFDGNGCPHKITAYKLGKDIIDEMVRRGEYKMHSRSWRDIIRIGVQQLEGDHIRGRNIPRANAKENIRTLCPICHKKKTKLEKNYMPGWDK